MCIYMWRICTYRHRCTSLLQSSRPSFGPRSFFSFASLKDPVLGLFRHCWGPTGMIISGWLLHPGRGNLRLDKLSPRHIVAKSAREVPATVLHAWHNSIVFSVTLWQYTGLVECGALTKKASSRHFAVVRTSFVACSVTELHILHPDPWSSLVLLFHLPLTSCEALCGQHFVTSSHPWNSSDGSVSSASFNCLLHMWHWWRFGEAISGHGKSQSLWEPYHGSRPKGNLKKWHCQDACVSKGKLLGRT